jgi:hypothetical protein
VALRERSLLISVAFPHKLAAHTSILSCCCFRIESKLHFDSLCCHAYISFVFFFFVSCFYVFFFSVVVCLFLISYRPPLFFSGASTTDLLCFAALVAYMYVLKFASTSLTHSVMYLSFFVENNRNISGFSARLSHCFSKAVFYCLLKIILSYIFAQFLLFALG